MKSWWGTREHREILVGKQGNMVKSWWGTLEHGEILVGNMVTWWNLGGETREHGEILVGKQGNMVKSWWGTWEHGEILVGNMVTWWNLGGETREHGEILVGNVGTWWNLGGETWEHGEILVGNVGTQTPLPSLRDPRYHTVANTKYFTVKTGNILKWLLLDGCYIMRCIICVSQDNNFVPGHFRAVLVSTFSDFCWNMVDNVRYN
jgi:hypothetical protein